LRAMCSSASPAAYAEGALNIIVYLLTHSVGWG